MTKSVAIYLRVSTTRQVKQDISIPDQRNQAQEYCNVRGWEITKEYVEAGKSATNDKRPSFQKMIADACSKEPPFDIILVYSFSRFFRDAIDSGVYRRKLEKYGVMVESMTQDFGDGHDGELLKNIIAAVDEHASKENGKNTLSRMIENAKQGFWNGAIPPYGYKVATAEIRGEKKKKKLAINPEEAEVVRKIYKLYLDGSNGQGSMGIKAIAAWLNDRGYRKRNGKPFYTSNIYKIFTHSTYCGEHYFNTKENKTGKAKPREEWVMMEAPVIIPKAEFDKVQRLLKQKSPSITPSRNQTSCTLLSGIAKCVDCQCNYMLMTSGKSKNYKYYKPATKFLKSNNLCNCKNIPMKYLDDLIMDEIANRMLEPSFVRKIIDDLSKNKENKSDHIKADLRLLQKEFRETEKRLNNLYSSLADGKVQNFETLNEFIDKENLRMQELKSQIKAKQQLLGGTYNFSHRQIELFTEKLREALTNGSVEFRKQRLKDFVDHIEIGNNEVRILASKTVIAETMLDMKKGGYGKVRSSDREWRANMKTNANIKMVIKLPKKYCKAD